jgi:cytidine deaminase
MTAVHDLAQPALQSYSELSEVEQKLVDAAVEARKNAYCRYSDHSVGAALLTKSGLIFTGCNVENAAWATICAERVAVVKAVSEGEREFVKLVLACKAVEGWPCGVCRQYMVEFGPHLEVIAVVNKEKQVRRLTLAQLLPFSFGPHSIDSMSEGSTL